MCGGAGTRLPDSGRMCVDLAAFAGVAAQAPDHTAVRASDHGVRPRTVSLGTTSIMSRENSPL